MNLPTLSQGDKVRIVFNAGLPKLREAVWAFHAINKAPDKGVELGNLNQRDDGEDVFVFNARPLAGTQEIKRKDIREMYLVSKDSKMYLPRIYRGEVRMM